MAGLPPTLERGISPEIEIKPFVDVTPLEIASRLNIHPEWIDYDTDGTSALNLDAIGVNGSIQFGGEDRNRADGLNYFGYPGNNGEYHFDLRDSEAILGEGFVTIVNPVDHTNQNGRKDTVSWIRLTRDGLDFTIRTETLGQWPADVTPDILRAAGNAVARLQTVNSA